MCGSGHLLVAVELARRACKPEATAAKIQAGAGRCCLLPPSTRGRHRCQPPRTRRSLPAAEPLAAAPVYVVSHAPHRVSPSPEPSLSPSPSGGGERGGDKAVGRERKEIKLWGDGTLDF